MTSAEIRQAFLDFFANKNHQIVSSSSLVPIDDPTLLFINAGMVQFKDVFLGNDPREYTRATTVQRCVRAGGKHNDLENVGYTARHHTFFEMMGNFSFGDYFKREAMTFAWDFLTKELKLPEDKLWVTVYEEDQESEDIWLKEMGISADRFSRCKAKDNFWSMGDTGPCGPCTEIFYDHGADVPGGPPGSPDEDGDRYIEIWNLVFMQFERSADGTLTDLPEPSVDTGMGLERLAAILQGVHSNYEIDLFQALMKSIAKEINVTDHEQTSIRVIADHIRSCAFMAVDGVVPSNEGRGYVMRRIIRRAIRHAYKLEFKGEFFYKIVDTLVEQMGAAYPELVEAQERVKQVLQKEEKRFAETVEQGMKILQEQLDSMEGDTISGEVVFKLYDTYGFPFDLTADIAREKGLKLDEAGYDVAMKKQQEMARAASGFKLEDKQKLAVNTQSDFLGYDQLTVKAEVKELFVDGIAVDSIEANQEALLVLNQTPFYAESGGQTADKGVLYLNKTDSFIISDVQKVKDSIVHFGKLTHGSIKVGDTLSADVDKLVRDKIAANHSATHLLHAALRHILGDHVQQKGSMVTQDRLRFDFSHDAPITTEQLQQIEDMANEQVRKSIAVETNIMPLEQAKASGAMALFGEKYADDVRVLSMGDFSVELCGGIHIKNTADINVIKVTGETGIASGVRRIEALSGVGALSHLQATEKTLKQIAVSLKGNMNNVEDKISALVSQNKQLEKQLKESQQQLAKFQGSGLVSKAEELGDIKILCATLDNTDGKALRDTMDNLKSKLPQAVILLAGVQGDKIALVSAVSQSLTAIIKAGDIMKDIAVRVGGKGGGRPDMAQGGGTDVGALPEAMKAVKQSILEKLG